MEHIHREITPLKDNDCFLVFDRRKNTFSFPLHFHPEYEINFIHEAEGAKRVVGDHIGTAKEYELVMVGPNLYHGWQDGKTEYKKMFHETTIQFPRELFTTELLDKNIIKPIAELLINSNRGILFSEETARLAEPKIDLLSKKRGFDSFLEFLSLLYDLAISRDQILLTNLSFQQQDDFYNSERIEKIYQFVRENYQQKIKLEDMAKMVNLSVVSFSRLIKQRTGKSFIDFINEIRLGYATRMLIETTKSVAEVCFNCGFNNISNFNRIFKKKQGCTPSEFRVNFNDKRNVF